MSIQLSDDRERQVQAIMQKGRYRSADEVIENALQLLDQQSPVKTPLTGADFDQMLMDAGVMSQVPDADADFDDPSDQPCEIIGEPISETILRERR